MPRVLPVVLAALVLAGCGGAEAPEERPAAATPSPSPAATAPPGGGDEAGVRELIAAWQRALRAGDAQTACRQLLAREVLARVEALGGSCERDLLRERIAEAGPEYRMEITELEVSGQAAKVTVRESGRDGTSTREQPVVRQGGRWRLGI